MRTTRLGVLLSLSLFPCALGQERIQIQRSGLSAAPGAGLTILVRGADGSVSCRAPGEAEARHLERRDVPLHDISEPRRSPEAGLTIQLRATQQLEANPQAKAAFQRAAQAWQQLITSPVTVILDVDYGTTRFGEPYPAGTLGSTQSQTLSGNIYSQLRSAMLAQAGAGAEQTLVGNLPPTSVPTDLGTTTTIYSASSTFRALGLLDPVPDPAAEEAQGLGKPPSIGFNSNFTFDLNPDDGITAGQTDFLTVAIHEIGHALGFGSVVGLREVSATAPLGVSLLDLFRFRPGIASTGAFSTGTRVQTTGGTQVFYTGSAELGLSTGNPEGKNGDSRQASHWKDDQLSGTLIGIMDPSVAAGQSFTITQADKTAFDLIGWTLSGGGSAGAPAAPGNLTATLATATEALLSWTDGSDNETEFRVEQNRDNEGWGDIGSSPANSTGARITGLRAATVHRFRVRARNASGDSPYSNEASVTTPGGAGGCVESSTVMCLSSSRFRVESTWRTSDGRTGSGQAVRLTGDTGYFWFFDQANVEVITKVLGVCSPPFNRYWVFSAGLTNVEVTLTVTDTKNGSVKRYSNPQGIAFQPVQDTDAFATCP